MSTEPVITSGPFSYTAQGFARNGITRADPQVLYSILNATHPDNARRITDKPTSKWYTAQLGHYNITPTTGSKPVLIERLRRAFEHGLCRRQPDDLHEMEESMKETWLERKKELNSSEILEKRKKTIIEYASAATDDEMLAIDGGELWLEEFRKSGNETGVLKHISHCVIWGHMDIYHIAPQNGFYIYGWNMEGDPEFIKWIAVGYDRNAVITRAKKEIEEYTHNPERILKEKKDVEEGEGNAALEARKEFPENQPLDWDNSHILGIWEISCPAIQELWSNINNLTMTLFSDLSGKVIGNLELGVINGILELKGKPTAANPFAEIYWANLGANGEIITEDNGNRGGRIEFLENGAVANIIFDEIVVNEIIVMGSDVTATAIKVSQNPVREVVDYEGYIEEAYMFNGL